MLQNVLLLLDGHFYGILRNDFRSNNVDEAISMHFV